MSAVKWLIFIWWYVLTYSGEFVSGDRLLEQVGVSVRSIPKAKKRNKKCRDPHCCFTLRPVTTENLQHRPTGCGIIQFTHWLETDQIMQILYRLILYVYMTLEKNELLPKSNFNCTTEVNLNTLVQLK